MTITVVFDPPLPSDSPATFNTKAFSTLGDLNTWSTQANALAGEVSADEASAASSASTASTAAGTATTKAGEALSSANSASTSAGTATTQAGIAITKAAEAEASAADAAATVTGKVTGPASATDNAIARYDGTTGKLIQSSSATLDDSGNLSAAGATFSGNVNVAGNTRFGSAGSPSGGAAIQVIKAESYAARFANSTGTSSVVVLSLDPGNNGEGVRDSQVRATNNGINQTTLELFTADSAAPTKKLNITHTGLITAENSVGFGYGAGSGGTVTQATSKTTAVTLNKPSGQITTTSDSLAANTNVTFTLTNSVIGANDTVSLSVVGGGNPDAYLLRSRGFGGGGVVVTIINQSGFPLTDAIQIQFNVIKGSTT